MIQAAAERSHWALAVIAMISATISGFLYLRIIATMYFIGGGEHGDEPVEFAGPKVLIPKGAAVSLALALIGTLVLGVVPSSVEKLTEKAIPEFIQTDGR